MQAVSTEAAPPVTYGAVRRPPFATQATGSFAQILAQSAALPRLSPDGGVRWAPLVAFPYRIPGGGVAAGLDRAAAMYEPAIQATAARHQLPAGLLRAVVRVESSFDPLAVSPVGASGLMQLMPATARNLGVSNVFDPLENLDGGARYLKRQIDTFGSIPLGLAAYHAGPNAVRAHGGIPPFSTTQRYVERVLALMRSGEDTA